MTKEVLQEILCLCAGKIAAVKIFALKQQEVVFFPDAKATMVKPSAASARPPKFRECPLCSREFGSRSLDIHLPKCAEKTGKQVGQ